MALIVDTFYPADVSGAIFPWPRPEGWARLEEALATVCSQRTGCINCIPGAITIDGSWHIPAQHQEWLLFHGLGNVRYVALQKWAYAVGRQNDPSLLLATINAAEMMQQGNTLPTGPTGIEPDWGSLR
ncbi:hypothetical protein VaNZ11_006970 [Volvox africanus]|uniref:Uncharacterized protein n=1 Tax=Volvox africanus TaxID=51714 RepID=A0ABQ5S3F4_9CHLO|nr:hypothetical protein VaNZ11_006970 [Volvox africanus]